MASNFHKPVDSFISLRKETLTEKEIRTGTYKYQIPWTKVTRGALISDTTNYVSSFNLPHETSAFSSGSSFSLAYPELQHLNTESFVVGNIHGDLYNEIIDGRSLSVQILQTGGTSPSFYVTGRTLVSSTYHVLQKSENNALLGNNIAFLFCDDLNLPYTGTTDGGAGTRASITSWSASTYTNRPSAVSYQNLQESDINSDKRSWLNVDTGVPVPEIYPTTTNQGYNYDIPAGYVSLDKGFIIITHPTIVNNISWRSGLIEDAGGGFISNTGSSTTNVFFNSYSSASFYEIEIEYKINVVCSALPGEFYFTNNPTWDFEGNLSEYQLGTKNFDPIYITEIGLYNKNDELVALAKIDRPKEKTYNNIVMFSLNIDV